MQQTQGTNASSETPYPPPSASYPPPNGPPPQGAYGGPPPGGPYGQYPQQPQNYYAAPPPAPAHHGRPPLVSIISPDDAKKIRKMQLVNFAATLMQLGCSLAVILIVRNSLYRVEIRSTGTNSAFWSTSCLAATPDYPGTCEYAYSLASVSIFFGFILSLMQCLTMDCCGAGRAIEAGFDAAACAWWVAGGITLGLRASEANNEGIEQRAARNAVVALCWISAFLFGVLLVTNFVLIKRLGRAYKAAAQQMQQHLTAMPVTGYPQGGGVQMGAMGGPPAGYPPQSTPPQHWGAQPAGGAGAAAPYPGATGAAPYAAQTTTPPAGYPSQFTPPAATTGTHAV